MSDFMILWLGDIVTFLKLASIVSAVISVVLLLVMRW